MIGVEGLLGMSAGTAVQMILLAWDRHRNERSGDEPGQRVADALAIVELADRLLTDAVAVERAGGTSWESIGERLNVGRSSAHGRFAEAVRDRQYSVEESPHAALRSTWRSLRDRLDRELPGLTTLADLPDDERAEFFAALEAATATEDAEVDERVAAALVLGAARPERADDVLRRRLDRAVDGSRLESGLPEAATTTTGPAAADAGAGATVDALVGVQRRLMSKAPSNDDLAFDTRAGATARLLATTLLARFEQRGDRADLDEAVVLLRTARTRCFRTEGPAGPGTVRATMALARSLAALYTATGEERVGREAVELLEEADMHVRRQHLPMETAVRDVYLPWSKLTERRGHADQTEEILYMALSACDLALGADHPATLLVVDRLADVVERRAERPEQAVHLLARLCRGASRHRSGEDGTPPPLEPAAARLARALDRVSVLDPDTMDDVNEAMNVATGVT